MKPVKRQYHTKGKRQQLWTITRETIMSQCMKTQMGRLKKLQLFRLRV